MSLVGNIEDLGLGDILQIVSLSRKSGVLRLSRGDWSGAIVFRNGLVITAYSSEVRQNLAELLAEHGIITGAQRDEALQVWNDSGRQDALAELVERLFDVDHARVQEVIREAVERAVFQLFSWIEGSFLFELKEVGDELEGFPPDAAEFVLEQGQNPQWLAMEGTRLLDESRAGVDVFGGADVSGGMNVRLPGEPDVKKAISPAEPIKEPAPERKAAPAPPSATLAEEDELIAPSPAPAVPAGDGVEVLVIDDDSLVLSRIAEKLRERGLSVETAGSSATGLKRLDELVAAGRPPAVVADLLMPRSDDAGILGGIEIVEHVRERNYRSPVMVITDYENADAQKKAEVLGVNAFLRKPRKAQVSREGDTPELSRFIEEALPLLNGWVRDLRQGAPTAEDPAAEASTEAPSVLPSEGATAPAAEAAASGPNGAESSELIDMRAELSEELQAVIPHESELPRRTVQPTPGLAMLKAMTAELNDPNSNVEITLLVLRFAAELMSRAVIFVVTHEDVRGLGEFGVEIPDDNPTKRVRRMRLPLDKPSILEQVVETREVYKGPMPEAELNDYIVEMLGNSRPGEVFVAPISSSGRVVAVLYADNIPEDHPIGDTEALEIFLVQAGMAMDRALLERQLRMAAGRGGS